MRKTYATNTQTSHVNDTDLDSKAVVKGWLDACYSDRPAGGYWMIADHHVEYLATRLKAIIARERLDEASHYCDEGHYHDKGRDLAMLPSERVAELKAEAAQKGSI